MKKYEDKLSSFVTSQCQKTSLGIYPFGKIPQVVLLQLMDKGTIKTPNSICWLFFKIDLLTDFAA
jgi:hypothetical protein